MNWRLLFLWLILLFTGCSNLRIKRELNNFIDSTVQIPSMEMVLNGKFIDTLSNHRTLDVKLLTYYTSAKGCLSCWLSHLHNFERFFGTEINTIFTPIVVISLDDNTYSEDVFRQLSIQPHSYPIYVDKKHLFEQTNIHLPTDYRLHTFLIDKNNRVVLVGNPFTSDAMLDLYKSTLDNMLTHDGVYVPEK